MAARDYEQALHRPCVRVAGPLASYAAGFRAELTDRGYAPRSAGEQLDLMAQLSGWLAGQGLDVDGLTAPVVAHFAGVMRTTRRHLVSARALAPLLGYFRGRGVGPEPEAVAAGTPREQLLAAYRGYLLGERGVTETTAANHMRVAAAFLAELADPLGEALTNLSAEQVLGIVSGQVRGGVPSATRVAGSIRVLLRFLYSGGQVSRQLASVVPPAASWRLASLPGRLDAAAVTVLLGGCDRTTEGGRRNYAILLVLARLGLRASEVAALALDDVDWRAAEITIRGKGGRLDKLPLPRDVGEVMADYLRDRQPGCACRALFITVRAPRHGLTGRAVGSVVRRACARAGIPQAGPHRLRHGLASDLLAAGASLAEIGQVLRHRDPLTTAIYAKVDRKALATLARPWPLDQPGQTP
jgi:integrase/recombinase XerD